MSAEAGGDAWSSSNFDDPLIEAYKSVLPVYLKLLEDDQSKDVEIEMLDGTLLAHSVMLRAGSDALQGILENTQAGPGGRKRLSWKEHSLEVGKFFLQLLYTNTVAEEWNREGDDPGVEPPLRLLLGSLAIAKMFVMQHPYDRLHSTVKAVSYTHLTLPTILRV